MNIDQYVDRELLYIIPGMCMRKIRLLPNKTIQDDTNGRYEHHWDINQGAVSQLVIFGDDGRHTMSFAPRLSHPDKGPFTPAMVGKWVIEHRPAVLLKPLPVQVTPHSEYFTMWSRVIIERAIVTGCDAAQEWMLPIWFMEVRKFMDWPIVFGDFGMSAQARKWCEARGRVVEAPKCDAPHFRKPFAIMQAAARAAIWMDLDALPRASLVPLLDAPGDIVCTTDIPSTDCGLGVQSGVVLIRHGSFACQLWAKACMRGFALPSHSAVAQMCDQPLLNSVAEVHPEFFAIVGREWNWLVPWMGENNDAKVWHFAGAHKHHIERVKTRQVCEEELQKGASSAESVGDFRLR